MTNTDERLYFAYGSNLDSGERNEQGIDLDPVGPAWLLDHDLAFTRRSERRRGGVLDVVPTKGSAAPGYLFRASATAWERLDDKEAVRSNAYERYEAWACRPDGSVVPVRTYKVVCPGGHEKPTSEYVDIVKSGREKLEMPSDDLDMVARGERAVHAVTNLFVYGTLMRGEQRGAVLAPFAPACWILAEAPGHLVDCGTYPGLVLGGESVVSGELVRLPAERLVDALERCDEIERFEGWGGGSLFERRVISVGVGDGRVRRAWTYVLARPEGFPVLESGDWRRHRGVRTSFLRRLVAAHLAGASEEEVARRLVEQSLSFGPVEEAVRALLPLVEAVDHGALSERRLAQCSGGWTALTRGRFGGSAC